MRKFIILLLFSAFITLTYAQSYTRSNNNFTQVTTTTSDIKTEYTYTIKDVVYEYWQNKASSSQRKFSEQQMDSYFFTCKEQFLIANKYERLEKYAQQFLIRSFVLLYAKGYSRKFIKRYANKYSLSNYLSCFLFFRLFPMKIAVKYSIQKLFCPIFRNVE